ncbi:uncharacterized protein PAC_16848 [Phialocephala subalpina]|uniref:Heterokaryon incompatibility domain-containing protein n=1 Tax=Phialocephala subalpina TaxID=576137 RepID=A0A1L7XPJ3_9HELO|nr:uncharacterized protein PAC_16848 [Phialocephala subalpina]
MTSNENSFQYDSFLQGRHIRLLIVEPPDKRSTLLKVTLWRRILTEQNLTLCHTSRAIKTTSAFRALLVDAVYINQNCDSEKTQRVRMMRDIYCAATSTIIWLRSLERGDVEGIRLAELVYGKCQKDDYRYDEDSFRYNDFNCEARGVPDVMEGQDMSPSWKALFNILTHCWFSRIWIVQKLLVSQKPLTWRGDKSMNTDVMLWMAKQIGGKGGLVRSLRMIYDSPTFHSRAISLCRYRYEESNPHQIWITISNTIGMEATDIRDRYFALAGISTGPPSGFVNYSRTLEQIACQVG